MNDFLSKLKPHRNILHKTKNINPHKHWVVLLKVFFIVSVISIILNLLLSYLIKKEKIFQTQSVISKPPSLLKEKLLNDVTESFNQKEVKSNEFKTVKVFKDPSL